MHVIIFNSQEYFEKIRETNSRRTTAEAYAREKTKQDFEERKKKTTKTRQEQ